MGGVSLFFDYFKWHYGRAYSYALTTWANLMWFIVHFFSISLLLRTLFSPWKRIHEEYHKTGVEDFFATIIVNSMTRIVGFLVRLTLLLVGLVSRIVGALSLLVWFAIWMFLPVLIIATTLYGIMILTL